jgi:hypothetical protein
VQLQIHRFLLLVVREALEFQEQTGRIMELRDRMVDLVAVVLDIDF